MPELEFVGDWDAGEAQRIAQQLQKSLGVGEGGGAEVTVQQMEDNPIQTLLSKRQQKLIDLLRQAGHKAFEGAALAKGADVLTMVGTDEHECGPGCDHGWDQYQLGGGSLAKAVGTLKRDAQGRTYRKNSNNRWERFDRSSGGGAALPEFRFTAESGPFGTGVYFPVLRSPQGYLRLRVRADIFPAEMISDEQFHELESDFARDLGHVLDGKGVQAIAQTDGEGVSLLCIRSAARLQVLGAIADSGGLPPGDSYGYSLVKVTPADDHVLVEVEVSPAGGAAAPQGNELIKSAGIFTATPLSGLGMVGGGGPRLDRAMLRAAVERCTLDGVPFGDVSIKVVDGVPEVLPPDTYAFCYPEAADIYLVHHDPTTGLAKHQRMLTRELRTAARQGAIPHDVALDTILRVQEIDATWWLEYHLKRSVGAILAAKVHNIATAAEVGPWSRYLTLLAGRGLSYWGSRRAIAECIAEDYRCAHDPAGFPNEVTMLWDLAVPSVARMAQQELLNVLRGGPLEKAAVGTTKTEGGVTYRLNSNHRWERVGGDAIAPGQLSLLAPEPESKPSDLPTHEQAFPGQTRRQAAALSQLHELMELHELEDGSPDGWAKYFDQIVDDLGYKPGAIAYGNPESDDDFSSYQAEEKEFMQRWPGMVSDFQNQIARNALGDWMENFDAPDFMVDGSYLADWAHSYSALGLNIPVEHLEDGSEWPTPDELGAAFDGLKEKIGFTPTRQQQLYLDKWPRMLRDYKKIYQAEHGPLQLLESINPADILQNPPGRAAHDFVSAIARLPDPQVALEMIGSWSPAELRQEQKMATRDLDAFAKYEVADLTDIDPLQKITDLIASGGNLPQAVNLPGIPQATAVYQALVDAAKAIAGDGPWQPHAADVWDALLSTDSPAEMKRQIAEAEQNADDEAPPAHAIALTHLLAANVHKPLSRLRYLQSYTPREFSGEYDTLEDAQSRLKAVDFALHPKAQQIKKLLYDPPVASEAIAAIVETWINDQLEEVSKRD